MTLQAIKPAEFPWFPYEGFTFCLGLSEDGGAWSSGHTAAAHDASIGKMTVSGTMAEQARIAYRKVMTIIEAAGYGPDDVVHVTENVTVAGLADYEAAAAARREVFGAHEPTVTTVVVERLVRSAALLEVELHAVRGGGAELLAASERREAGTWAPSPVREGYDGTVHLPTMVPVDESGDIVSPGDFVGQYAYCLDRADALLRKAGLSLDNAVTTYDYSTPATRDVYRKTHRVRKERLGGAGVYPGAGGILMSRLHAPEVLVAIDVTASRHPLEPVNPGWSRYDSLTYAPGVRAGRTLFMSGFAALDLETQEALHPGDIGAQAEVTYGSVLRLLEYAGLGPADLLSTIEFCVESALRDYRAVAGVRERLLSPPWPASTGAICKALLRPEFLLEVFPTALYPEGAPTTADAAAGNTTTGNSRGGRFMTLLTDDIRALIGRTKVYTAPEPMGAAAGRYFGLAIGDHNPLYSDPEYARAQGLADVTAPPTLICETNQYANLPVGPDGDAGHNWGIEIPGTRKVRGGNRYVFHRRVLPSDVVTATWEIADITAKTNRAGAEMLIVTSRATYTRQDGALLAENEETIIFVSLEARA